MMSSGANYEIAQITARLTNSYLVTDLHVRWREIELDREQENANNEVWSPFAKAIQETPFKYLNQVELPHALKLREEGLLDTFRQFLRKVWVRASTEKPFSGANALLLAEELKEEVRNATAEWEQIDRDLKMMVAQGGVGGFMAAGPMIAEGWGMFLAAAGVVGAGIAVSKREHRRNSFPHKFPAAFFMNIDKP